MGFERTSSTEPSAQVPYPAGAGHRADAALELREDRVLTRALGEEDHER